MSSDGGSGTVWFSTRCVFHHADLGVFEERITVWEAGDSEAAIELAEREAEEYAEVNDIRFNGFVQAYAMFDRLESGAEVFSLARGSELTEEDYLTRFFDTGDERQRESDEND